MPYPEPPNFVQMFIVPGTQDDHFPWYPWGIGSRIRAENTKIWECLNTLHMMVLSSQPSVSTDKEPEDTKGQLWLKLK